MSASLRKRIVFCTLPLAVLWAVFNLPSNKPTQVSPPSLPESQVTQAVQPIEPDPLLIDVEEKARQPWGQDPFRSYTYRRQVKPRAADNTALEWVLGGIVYNHNNPLAFVNNQTVHIGDKLGQATVVAIDKRTVTIEYRGQRIELKLNKG